MRVNARRGTSASGSKSRTAVDGFTTASGQNASPRKSQSPGRVCPPVGKVVTESPLDTTMLYSYRPSASESVGKMTLYSYALAGRMGNQRKTPDPSARRASLTAVGGATSTTRAEISTRRDVD